MKPSFTFRICRHTFLALLVTGLVSSVRAQSGNNTIRDEISYSNDIRPLVREFCTTCHAGEDPEGEFVLTSYDDVRRHTEQGELLKRINDPENPMPQSGLLPKYMRRLFKQWALSGYPNKGQKRMSSKQSTVDYQKFEPPVIVPVDISQRGFDLLEKMQGHWVGTMNLMGQDYDWMAFDYRAIAPSHVHGIFEGGTIGNLFTSFFVTKFNGRRTIMARNGGILNGIYRTSYFVLDLAERRPDGDYYRLVDAYGGQNIMWMELTFRGDRLEFNSYTSRFGLTAPPTRHMSFHGRRMHPELAAAAAKAVGFPQNTIDRDFSAGLPKPNWGDEVPQTSASYIWEDDILDLVELGRIARDPYRIDQMPYVSKLSVNVQRNEHMRDKKLHVYLSNRPLTDDRGKFITQFGYVRADLLDGLLSFPELSKSQNDFTFTYLHPGAYYLTVVADMDGDGYPSPGDLTHAARRVVVAPEAETSITVSGFVQGD